ncbi:hypothetical protein [Picosynechococcus sp. NKBG042902]|uniref:hypothetical protein n=1 Tax=Picosynechococcus sp. NKBG042902 TaxID=490193 RepID=UPI0004AB8687|nr:hypothetical protein [Picosynechococcus sp. NKBG042902]
MFFFLKQLTSWDRWNQFLVSLSILAFLPLQFPQVISNAAVISTGNPAAIATLGVIPVGGYAAGILGNLLLMNFLAGQREFWGTTVQAVGIVTADIVIFQLFQVGFIPGWLFWPATLFLLMGMVLNYGHFLVGDRPSWQAQFWPQWRRILQWLGIALLPALVVLQLHDAFFPNLPEWPGGLGAAFLLSGLMVQLIQRQTVSLPNFFQYQNRWRRGVMAQSTWLKSWLRRGWRGLAGWTANLLFMFNSLAQFVNCLIYPDDLAALSLTTQVLFVVGNLLMLSRSGTLLIAGKDRIWCASTLWDLLMRVGIFACLLQAGLLSLPLFCVFCGAIAIYLSFIFLMTKRVYPSSSLADTAIFLLFGRSPQWQPIES